MAESTTPMRTPNAPTGNNDWDLSRVLVEREQNKLAAIGLIEDENESVLEEAPEVGA